MKKLAQRMTEIAFAEEKWTVESSSRWIQSLTLVAIASIKEQRQTSGLSNTSRQSSCCLSDSICVTVIGSFIPHAKEKGQQVFNRMFIWLRWVGKNWNCASDKRRRHDITKLNKEYCRVWFSGHFDTSHVTLLVFRYVLETWFYYTVSSLQ